MINIMNELGGSKKKRDALRLDLYYRDHRMQCPIRVPVTIRLNILGNISTEIYIRSHVKVKVRFHIE